MKPGARPRPQQRHGALTRQIQKVCIARAQTACAVARAKEVEEARLAAAKAEAAGEQKAKEAHAAAMKAAEEGMFSSCSHIQLTWRCADWCWGCAAEAKRKQAAELEKAAAAAAAAPPPAPAPAPAPRPQTPPPAAAATRAKTPPSIPTNRAKSPKGGAPPIPKSSKAPAIPGKGKAKGGALFGEKKSPAAAAKSAAAAKGIAAAQSAAAAAKPSEGKQYKVVCPGGVLARAGFAMNSKKAGTLQAGDVISALETKLNPNGITRIRFAGKVSGWVSTKAGDGTPLLEEVAGKAPAAAASAAPAKAGAQYKAVLNGLCREGFEMSTKKAGTLKKGEVITALEEKVNEKGVTRVRFATDSLQGWVSTNAGDGSVLLQKVGGAKAAAPAAAAEDDGPPGRMIWYALGDDEVEVTVKEFRALVKQRRVKEDTEVWVDGKMDDWLPFGEVGMAKLVAP